MGNSHSQNRIAHPPNSFGATNSNDGLCKTLASLRTLIFDKAARETVVADVPSVEESGTVVIRDRKITLKNKGQGNCELEVHVDRRPSTNPDTIARIQEGIKRLYRDICSIGQDSESSTATNLDPLNVSKFSDGYRQISC